MQDESASVRDAGVILLGRHISAQKDLVDTYFNTVTSACKDTSTSVRKSALKILWEACIQPDGSAHGTEACIVLLQHVNDPEASIQELVSRMVSRLWRPGETGTWCIRSCIHCSLENLNNQQTPCASGLLAVPSLSALDTGPCSPYNSSKTCQAGVLACLMHVIISSVQS